MNNKSQILTAILIGLNSLGFAQDSTEIKPLKFLLEIIVSDEVDTTRIEGASVKIIGIDGSSLVLETDSNGIASTSLKPKTSYSISVNKKGLYKAMGQETTIGFKQSTKIIREFKMREIQACHMYGPSIQFDHNNFESARDSLFPKLNIYKNYYNLITENEQWDFQITGFCESTENEKISKRRAKNFRKQLMKMGVPKARMKIDFKNAKTLATESTAPSLQDKSLIINNRIILLGIIYD